MQGQTNFDRVVCCGVYMRDVTGFITVDFYLPSCIIGSEVVKLTGCCTFVSRRDWREKRLVYFGFW
jgi:hypothetical protein